MKTRKLSNKITEHPSDIIFEHTFDIIFGILSGSGLMFVVNVLITLITFIVPILQQYFTILYSILYLIILIPTSIFFSKGWFRVVYLITSLVLLFIYVVY